MPCCECAPIQQRARIPEEREIECGGRRREMGRGVERGKEGGKGRDREGEKGWWERVRGVGEERVSE